MPAFVVACVTAAGGLCSGSFRTDEGTDGT